MAWEPQPGPQTSALLADWCSEIFYGGERGGGKSDYQLGYQEDGDTGLKLLGHRYYDSTPGRFLSSDPAQAGRNFYTYCGNSPLTRQDKTGLDWHNPGKVKVDPGFRGKVYAVGEPGEGQEQVLSHIPAGYQSHPGMDVDIVIIVMPDGSKKHYFLMGNGYGYQGGMQVAVGLLG